MTRAIGFVSIAAAFTAVSALATQGVSAAPPRGPRVLTRAFTGTYIEDITIVSRGPFSNFLVAVEGDGIYGAPLAAPTDRAGGQRALRQLVDFQGTLSSLPRGVAYLDSARAFVAADVSCKEIDFFDAGSGRLASRRQMQRPVGFAPTYCEGLAAIPASASQFGGDLLLVAMDQALSEAYLEVIRPDGQVVREIVPPAPARTALIGGVLFQGTDTIRIGVNYANGSASELWTLDLAGNETALPLLLNHSFDDGILEGIAEARDGRMFVTGVRSEIHVYDDLFRPRPAADRDYQLGLGFIAPAGIAWNASTGRLLVNVSDGTSVARTVQALSPTLDAASPVVDFSLSGTPAPQAVRGMTYLPTEQLLAVANMNAQARRVHLFEGGTPAGDVRFGTAPYERPLNVEYLPLTNEFAVRTATDATTVKIYTRTGAFVRQFDPRPIGVSSVGDFAYFTTSSGAGRLLFLMSGEQGVVTDLSGNRLETFNWRTTLGLIEPNHVTRITSGPYTGAFAAAESAPGSVTIFTIPEK